MGSSRFLAGSIAQEVLRVLIRPCPSAVAKKFVVSPGLSQRTHAVATTAPGLPLPPQGTNDQIRQQRPRWSPSAPAVAMGSPVPNGTK